MDPVVVQGSMNCPSICGSHLLQHWTSTGLSPSLSIRTFSNISRAHNLLVQLLTFGVTVALSVFWFTRYTSVYNWYFTQNMKTFYVLYFLHKKRFSVFFNFRATKICYLRIIPCKILQSKMHCIVDS